MNKTNLHSQSGLSIFELLIVVSLMLLMVVVSAEPIAAKMEEGQLGKISAAVYSAVSKTRNYAIENNRLVAICGSQDGEVCSDSWASQWIIFHDRNRNGLREESEKVYERTPAPEGQYHLYISSTKGDSVSFSGMGFSDELSTFQVCGLQKRLSTSQGIVIQRSGTITAARDNDGDGIRETHRSEPFNCEQEYTLAANGSF